MHFRPFLLLICSAVITNGLCLPASAEATGEKTAAAASERIPAGRAALLKDLESQSGWLKIYAAEGLLEIGVPEDRDAVRRVFLALDAAGPYSGTEQVGIWRVLARAADDHEELAQWVKKIETIFLAPEEPRRLHALETLCKLRAVSPEVARAAREWMESAPAANAPFCWWSIALEGKDGHAEALLALSKLLREEDQVIRIRTAFTLGQLAGDDGNDETATTEIAQSLRMALRDAEPKPEGAVKHQLQCALYLASHESSERATLREALIADLFTSPNSARLIASTLAGSLPEETATALAPRLTPLLTNENFHLRWAAARLLGDAE